MDYIYDIVLNFQNNYYDFYEWRTSDKIINVKKIPVYIVNNQDYNNLKHNEIILDIKTLPKSIKMFLVTNGQEVMGILLDKTGKIIKKSSLLFDEADEVLEEKETLKTLPLKYKKNIQKQNTYHSRNQTEKTTFLKKYFQNININNDKYLLKYIYYEIYNKEEEDIDLIYQKLNSLINTNIDTIYNSIKKVNTELNI